MGGWVTDEERGEGAADPSGAGDVPEIPDVTRDHEPDGGSLPPPPAPWSPEPPGAPTGPGSPQPPPPPQWPPPMPPMPPPSGPPMYGSWQPWEPPPVPEPERILAELPERAKQRRWTVLIRGILMIPLAVVIFLVSIAMIVCAIVGWFGALIMGRAPEFLRTIVTVFVRLNMRLHAYGLLLTDRFPPFSFEEVPEYRVALAVPPATKLNRAAVLFRLILAFPVNVLLTFLEYGSYVFAFVGWVAALVTGWLPQTFHDAFRAYLRYQARVTGYFFLLVPTYPDGLFGDDSTQLALSRSAQVAETPAGPSPWKLVLGTGAKRVLAIIIIVGVPIAIFASIERNSLFTNTVQNDNKQTLVSANNQLVSDFNQFGSTVKSCTNVSCLEQANGVFSGQLSSFVSTVQGAGDAGVNAAAVAQVTQAAQSAQEAVTAMAHAGSTITAYQQTAARVQIEQRLNALGSAQQSFATALNNS